jgi:hypothetical protein
MVDEIVTTKTYIRPNGILSGRTSTAFPSLYDSVVFVCPQIDESREE